MYRSSEPEAFAATEGCPDDTTLLELMAKNRTDKDFLYIFSTSKLKHAFEGASTVRSFYLIDNTRV